MRIPKELEIQALMLDGMTRLQAMRHLQAREALKEQEQAARQRRLQRSLEWFAKTSGAQ